MIVDVYPSVVTGSIKPPSSKSFLHRAIICASLAEGKSVINNVNYSVDVLATINAFKALGVQIDSYPDKLEITGLGNSILEQDKTVNCHESGSTMRFLIPLLSTNHKNLFLGNSGLLNRPMKIYENIFKSQGLYYQKNTSFIETKGRLKAGKYTVPGNVSSQFISGLLFVLPTLEGDSTINITDNFESVDYVNMTIAILKKFNIFVELENNLIHIKGSQRYRPTVIKSETDYSQLAFFAVLGILNNSLQILDVPRISLQADRRIIDFIERMGGQIEWQDDTLIIKKSSVDGATIDVSQCPDIAPVLALLLSKANGLSKIINADRLKIKESNRLLTTYETLKKMGVAIKMGDNSLEINGSNTLHGAVYDSYNDHRIAMMLGIAGTITSEKISITQAEAINKSYPDFFKDLQSLGVKIEYR